MKQKYFLLNFLFILLFSVSSFAQSVVITTVVDGTLKNGGCDAGTGTSDPRFVELYVDGTIDFTGYDLGYAANGGSYVKKALDAFGTISNKFIYVIASGDETTFDAAFPGRTRITMASTAINGNEAFNITDGASTVIDAFGDPNDISNSGDFFEPWVYSDSYAKRKNNITANGGTFDSANWTFGGNDALDGATCASLATAVNLGSFSITSTTWDGSDSSDWNTTANWSNGVPTLGYVANIPNGMPNEPTIGATIGATVNDISITGGAVLTIESGGSLIVSDAASGNLTYNVSVANTNWHLVSSPVVGEQYDDAWNTANSINVSGAGNNDAVSTYNNTTSASGSWNYFQTGGAATTFNQGQGYSLKRTGAGNYAFTGTFPTSDIQLSIDQNFGGLNKWNFIGNPFPSYIKVSELIAANAANLTDSHELVYVWNGTNYITLAGTDYIHPGQGFFVNADNSDANNFVITESLQSHQTGITFYKGISYPKIEIYANDGNNNQKFTEIRYEDNTTKGLDPGFDAGTFTGQSTSFSLYSHLVSNSDGVDFMLQALPKDDYENTIIPLGLNAASGNEITFTINHQNLPSDLMVFLEDKEKNTITRLDESNSNYKITLDNDSNGIGRFYLHTSTTDLRKTLDINDFNLDQVSVYLSSQRNLRIAGLKSDKAVLTVFNILGKKVYNQNLKSNSTINVSLSNAIKQGIYIVKIETDKGNITKKIFLK